MHDSSVEWAVPLSSAHLDTPMHGLLAKFTFKVDVTPWLTVQQSPVQFCRPRNLFGTVEGLDLVLLAIS